MVRKWLGSPQFISHERAKLKGEGCPTWGFYITIYTFWDDSPSAPCHCFDRGCGFLHLQVADAGGHVRTRLRAWAVDGCQSEDIKVVNPIFEN